MLIINKAISPENIKTRCLKNISRYKKPTMVRSELLNINLIRMPKEIPVPKKPNYLKSTHSTLLDCDSWYIHPGVSTALLA